MPVYRIGKWCQRHGVLYTKYGTPTGRRLKRKDDYQWEHNLVTELVRNNAQHPGLLRAIEWLDQFFPPEDATRVKPTVQPEVSAESRRALTSTFLRISPQGVTPLDVIIETAALWLVSAWRQRELDDGLALTQHLGTAVIYLGVNDTEVVYVNGKRSRRPKRIAFLTRHTIGAAIRGAMGVLLLNIAHACVAKVERDDQAKHDLRKPFNIT